LVREEGGLTFRPFSSLEDYEACVEFQEEIWGRGFSEKVPSAILMIANRLGGLAAGAFAEGGELQGFVFGLTGMVDGKPVHWSDMLAVRDGGRDRGLGTRLKEYQRDILLGWGVGEMRWTFDPLQGRNAYVNFPKLGCVSREYVENMYGVTGSHLHQGVGTDRLVASWSMGSRRVQSRLAGAVSPPAQEEYLGVPGVVSIQESETAEGQSSSDSPPQGFPSPGEVTLGLSDPQLLLSVPADIEAVMGADMPLAVRWREATREAFRHYISRGYEVREFFRGPVVSSYLLCLPETAP
jgi:predicted GNAT superfamily acetyltransferase